MAVIIHHPRVAWDGARVIVEAAGSDRVFGWLTEQIRDLLGPEHQRAMADTRWRLGRQDAVAPVEAGRWRVRLEDALREHPDRADALRATISEARVRLAPVS